MLIEFDPGPFHPSFHPSRWASCRNGGNMHHNFVIAILALAVAFAPLAQAQEKSSFKCTFGPGMQANWDSGKLKVEKASFGNPSVTLHFDAIDLTDGTARMIGNAGSSSVSVLNSGTSITLVEQTGALNFSFTTIFMRRIKGNPEFPAVMSRHIDTPSGPVPSQYYGACIKW
jgi:hypothetical protein